jgi:drug/metabolite transporter (DMT)-like permease
MAGWLRKPAEEPPLGPRERRLLFLESFLGNFLFSICMLYGVKWAGALAAGVVMAALPAAVALLSRLVLGERMTQRVVLAIGCAALGIALMALSRPVATGADAAGPGGVPWGHLLLVAAVLCEASYVVIGKRLTAGLGPRRISALVNLWGLALVTPLGLAQALAFDFASPTPGLWGLLVFYALAASMATVWLWMTGLRTVPASQAGVFTVMLPVTAAAVGLWLGEPFSAGLGAAFALALAGLLLATWPVRRPRRH